jgi:hypothetical protein
MAIWHLVFFCWKGKVLERDNQPHAHPRAKCARKRDGLPRPLCHELSIHASSSSASSARPDPNPVPRHDDEVIEAL